MAIHLSFPSHVAVNAERPRSASTEKEVIKTMKKIFLFTLTALLVVGAIVPDALNIPLAWQPWLFLTSIFWFIIYSSGTLNS